MGIQKVEAVFIHDLGGGMKVDFHIEWRCHDDSGMATVECAMVSEKGAVPHIAKRCHKRTKTCSASP